MAAQTIRELLLDSVKAYGDGDAFRYKVKKEIESKSYSDLKKDSERFSRLLEKKGLLGKHIALIGSTSYAWILSYFGIVDSGSVAVPLDASLPCEAAAELLRRADVSALVYSELRKDLAEAAKASCPNVTTLISMEEELFPLLAENEGSFQAEPDPDSLCTIMFTSGTTGKSKGVMLTHRNLADNATCLDLKIPPRTVTLTVLPIHHAYCLTMDILKALSLGAIICINDSIMRVVKNMKLFKPEMTLMVPMMIETVYNKLQDTPLIPKKLLAKEVFGGKLKTICSGGAYLNPEMVDKFEEYGIKILQGYGMTECSPVISINPPWAINKNSVGKLLPGCKAQIVEEEIWVKSPSVMMGYYKMPEETKETLEDGWLKTGDLGYVDDEGYLYITGRKKNLIILKNGENVSPEEIENELSKNRLVKEILVREADGVIQAEIFPDEEYAHRKKIKDIPARLQEIVDEFNSTVPFAKQVHDLKIRETEFDKTTSKKIKRY